MSEKLHFRGLWNIPGNDISISGVLDYSPYKGVSLLLFGTLVNDRRDKNIEVPVIFGKTSDGERITLYKSKLFLGSFNTNGIETSTYESMYMFVGALIPENELTFKCIDILYEDFDQWLGIYGFKRNEFKQETKETFVEYQQPDNISWSISECNECEFKFSTYAPNTKGISRICIEQKCEVSLYTKGVEQSFEALFNLSQAFRIFLTLAFFEKPLYKEIRLSKTLNNEKYGEYNKEVSLYFRTEANYDDYKEKVHYTQFLFTYADIKGNIESILKKWFMSENSLSPTIYGLAESFSNKPIAIEFSFLNIAHAIESLHRRARNDNRASLHSRLDDLINELPESVSGALVKPSKEIFIAQFKNSRNYYTHYDTRLEAKALKGSDLFYFTERCKILLVGFVLKEIGFTNAEVERIIFNKGVYLFNHIIKYEDAKMYFTNWE